MDQSRGYIIEFHANVGFYAYGSYNRNRKKINKIRQKNTCNTK